MPDRLDRLRDVLLVQCAQKDAYAAVKLADRPGTGVVVTTADRRDVWALAPVADEHPLLVDAGRYAGRRRRFAADPFDGSWMAAQREACLPVLTDSGYLAQHDEAGLVSVLQRAARLGDAIATLPMHPWWLDQAGGLGYLLDQVHATGVPIAVALEHRDDPLGVQRTLRGLLALLRGGVPVIQLRCDVSGLGLLCHGAWAAAVGTRSGLRHIYPIATGGSGGRAASVATVVRDCLSFVAIDKIARAVRADRESSLWNSCTCRVCADRQLDWIDHLHSHEEREAAAFGHALETLFDLRDHLLKHTASRLDRQVSWREHCGSALFRYEELHAARQDWSRAPAFLRRWLAL